MDLKALRDFIGDHPHGVRIHMVDGTVYRVPHRDYVWFTPSAGPDPRGARAGTAFWLHDPDRDATRLVNAMLVKEVVPMNGNGKAHGRTKRARK